MNLRKMTRIAFPLIVVALVSTTACDGSTLTAAHPANSIPAPASTQVTHTLGLVDGVVTDLRTGVSLPTPSDMKELLVRTTESQRKYAALKVRIESDRRLRLLAARRPVIDRKDARAYVLRILETFSRKAAIPTAASSTGLASVVTDAPLCDELALAIYYTDESYREAQANQEESLDVMLEALAVGDAGGAFAAYSAWRQASIDIIFLQVDLGILASMYGAYGCWN